MTTLILAHGILGIGYPQFLSRLLPINHFKYFSDIAGSINRNAINVLEPSVSSVGMVEDRARDLKVFFKQIKKSEKIYIIAHSMGGLDCLKALPELLNENYNIVALTTLGTPYRGSEVADKVYSKIQDHKVIPISFELEKVLLGLGALGVRDLTTEISADRDLTQLNNKNIKITAIASNIRGNNNISSLFRGTSVVMGNEDNDGLVKVKSALPPEWQHIPNITLDKNIWEVDHARQIGWIPGLWVDYEHIARYHTIIANMTGMHIGDFAK